MKFKEQEHKYFLPEGYVERSNRTKDTLSSIEEEKLKGTDFLSVTTFLSSFKPYVDWDKKKRDYAKKNNMKVSEVTKLWDKAKNEGVDRGTKHHIIREEEIIENANRTGKKIYSKKSLEGVKTDSLLILEKDIIYPEKMVWLSDYRLCGTADLVEVTEEGVINIKDYKGLDIETEIPTTKGFIKLKDLSKKDLIYDGKGNITKIKNISEVHYNPCYKITFDSNDSILADHEHRWEIEEYLSKGINKTSIYTTEELKVGMKIPIVSVNKKDVDLPIDPYILGCWLGDGSSQSGTITNMNGDLWKEVERRGYILGPDISQGSSRKVKIKTIYGLRKKLSKLNLIHNKHLPEIYLNSSYQQRLDLLRGFMDTDGYWNKHRLRAVMVTTKGWQAQAIHDIVNSLGWKSTIIEAKTNRLSKKNIPCFHVVFNPMENPFLTRNQNILIKNTYSSKYRYIKNIEVVPTVPTKCIEVESSNHTYLFSRAYIKTHNTNKKLSFRSWSGEFRNHPEYLNFPVNNLENCDMSIYTLQLSLYMKMFLLHNPTFKPGSLTILHEKFDESGKYKHTVQIPIKYLNKEIDKLLKYREDFLFKIISQKN